MSSAIFTKGSNLYAFLFASLDDETFRKKGNYSVKKDTDDPWERKFLSAKRVSPLL